MTMKLRTPWLLLVASLITFSAHAQLSGCVDSPENPTVVLAFIGLVASGVPRMRKHLKERQQRRQHPQSPIP
jgi:XrtJ-associated TM-motif-TM protein